MKQVYLETFGCQMNVADSDRMELLLFQSGYRKTPFREDADLILVNTCSIREKAEQKVFSLFGNLKPLKQVNPGLKLGLTGCLAQQEKDNLLKKIPFLDFILGPDAIENIHAALMEVNLKQEPVVWTDFDQQRNYAIPEVEGLQIQGPSAYVNIIKGCDKFCSFCVVPFTRGREKSREADEIVQEVSRLVDLGAKEVILLGQNVDSYGKRGLDKPVSFPELLHQVGCVPGLERLRFTTSHPMDFTRDVIHAYRDLPVLMNHLHLPVQSGSDRILNVMRRNHTVENYLDLISELKREVPGIALTTDIIVGFPGETDQDFEGTLKLMEEVGFSNSYMFSYSPRPNTPAEEFEDSVPEELKKERLQQVIELQNRLSLELGQQFIGKETEIMVEETTTRKGASFRGRNPEYWNVLVSGDGEEVRPGDMIKVAVDEVSGHALKGRWVSQTHKSTEDVAAPIPL